MVKTLKFIFTSFVFIGILTSADCGSSPTYYNPWISMSFSWGVPGYGYGVCQYPYTCDQSYTRFDGLKSNASTEGTYRAKMTVRGIKSGTTKTWSIYPGSPDNWIVKTSSSVCIDQGYWVQLQRPAYGEEDFEVSLEVWLTCGGCGFSFGNALYFSGTQTIGAYTSSATGIMLYAPNYYGNSPC